MSAADKPLQSDLARARGLGSAKEGVQHWWAQRLTALALIPLGLWFVAELIAHLGLDQAAAAAWLRRPVVLGPTALLIVALFHHAQLGLQVVIEDYVGHEATKLAAIILVKAAAILLATAGLVALLTIAIGGGG
jgi:succinate dehydrogenase / fumarate reductase membrane anchor subunit